jgi:phospholipid/cholesterol/gamma-HCH transport system permease protein
MTGPATIPGRIGRSALGMLGDLGSLTLTGVEAGARLGRSFLPGERFRTAAVVQQVYRTGATALPIVALISLMIGLILAFQSAYQLERLGAIQYVASLVAVAITRELGPVITAIVVAGRSGSSIAAEISSMKIQEELDALEVMGFNTMAYLVAPRLLAMVIALPLLTAFADVVGIIGGLLCAVGVLDISAHQYIDTARESLHMKDFVTGLIKAGVFGAIIAVVGAWCGLKVEGGPEGVGIATTRSVVLGIFLVIVADLVFTGFFYNFG